VLFHKLEPVAKIVGITEGIFLLAVLVSIMVLGRRARVLCAPCRFLMLWVVALPAAYVLFDIQILSRYLLLTTPFTLALGFVALDDLTKRFLSSPVSRRNAMAVATLAAVALNLGFFFGAVVGPSRAFSRDLTHNLKSLALYIRDNSPEEAVVTAIDIGYLGFYSQRRVLDLGGLVDTTTRDLRRRFTYEEVVQRGLYLGLDTFPRVDYIVDRDTTPRRFDNKTIDGYRLESVRVAEMSNLGIRQPGPYFYTLYRIRHAAD
jgi:hypothetical protein